MYGCFVYKQKISTREIKSEKKILIMGSGKGKKGNRDILKQLEEREEK